MDSEGAALGGPPTAVTHGVKAPVDDTPADSQAASDAGAQAPAAVKALASEAGDAPAGAALEQNHAVAGGTPEPGHTEPPASSTPEGVGVHPPGEAVQAPLPPQPEQQDQVAEARVAQEPQEEEEQQGANVPDEQQQEQQEEQCQQQPKPQQQPFRPQQQQQELSEDDEEPPAQQQPGDTAHAQPMQVDEGDGEFRINDDADDDDDAPGVPPSLAALNRRGSVAGGPDHPHAQAGGPLDLAAQLAADGGTSQKPKLVIKVRLPKAIGVRGSEDGSGAGAGGAGGASRQLALPTRGGESPTGGNAGAGGAAAGAAAPKPRITVHLPAAVTAATRGSAAGPPPGPPAALPGGYAAHVHPFQPPPSRRRPHREDAWRSSPAAAHRPGAATDPEGHAEQLLARLREFVVENGGYLDPGWRCEVKVRITGNTAGTTDTYYFSPHGKRFRSRQEIAKALGLEITNPNAGAGGTRVTTGLGPGPGRGIPSRRSGQLGSPGAPDGAGGTASSGGGCGGGGGGGRFQGPPTPASSSLSDSPPPPAAPPAPRVGVTTMLLATTARAEGKRRPKASARALEALADAAHWPGKAGMGGVGLGGSSDEEEWEDEETDSSDLEEGGLPRQDSEAAALARAAAAAAAAARAGKLAQRGVRPPLRLKNSVVVELLGWVDPLRKGFHSRFSVLPLSYRAAYPDPSGAGTFFSEIRDGGGKPEFVVSLAPDGAILNSVRRQLLQRQPSGEQAAAAGPPQPSQEQQQQQQEGEEPGSPEQQQQEPPLHQQQQEAEAQEEAPEEPNDLEAGQEPEAPAKEASEPQHQQPKAQQREPQASEHQQQQQQQPGQPAEQGPKLQGPPADGKRSVPAGGTVTGPPALISAAGRSSSVGMPGAPKARKRGAAGRDSPGGDAASMECDEVFVLAVADSMDKVWEAVERLQQRAQELLEQGKSGGATAAVGAAAQGEDGAAARPGAPGAVACAPVDAAAGAEDPQQHEEVQQQQQQPAEQEEEREQQQPAEQQPAGQPPAGQPPAGQPPAEQQPAGQPPAGQPPAGQQPAGQQPAGQQPAGQQPPEQQQQQRPRPQDQPLAPDVAALLRRAGPLKGCWGTAMFGFNEASVLQLIEGMPGVSECKGYQYVDERGGWEEEEALLARGHAARRHAGAGASDPQQQQQQQQQQPPGDKAGAGTKRRSDAGGRLKGIKRPRGMSAEERPVWDGCEKVVDRMLRKLEGWWAHEEAREARRELKERRAAEARQQQQQQQQENQQQQQQQQQQHPEETTLLEAPGPQLPPPPPPPPPLVEDLLLPDAASASRRLPEPRPAARELQAAAMEQLLRAWEFCCRFGPLLGLDESSLAESDQQQQHHQHHAAAQEPIEPLRLLRLMEAGLIDSVRAGAEAGDPERRAARRLWVRLHAGLARLLCGDAYAAAAATLLRSAAGDAKEAAPLADEGTWREAAMRYLWAASAALYLSCAEPPPRGSAGAQAAAALAPDLPGRLAALGAADWAGALCGGGAGGVPGVPGSGLGPVPRGALLPPGSSETAAAAAAAADDAAALTAAWAVVAQLAGEAGAAAGDGSAEAAEPAAAGQQQLQQQQRHLQCRRLLQTLMSCRADKSAGAATGRTMCFYASEFGALLRWHKALDLRCVAARLEAGLYDGADGMEALVADISSACELWRSALGGFQIEVQRLPGFEAASARLADVVEAKAQQLLAKAKAGQALDADPPAAADGAAGAPSSEAAAEGGAEAAAAAAAPPALPAAGAVDAAAAAAAGGPVMLLPASLDPIGLRQAARPYNPFGIGCRVCWREADTRRILLCDGCNDEYHCYCLDPPLQDVPDEDFYCKACSEALAAGADFGGRRGVHTAGAGAPAAPPPPQPPARPSAPSAERLLAGKRLEEARGLARAAEDLQRRPYELWDQASRLELLELLVDLALGSRPVRHQVDRGLERKRDARREAAALRARASRSRREARRAAVAAAAPLLAGGGVAQALSPAAQLGGTSGGGVCPGDADGRSPSPPVALSPGDRAQPPQPHSQQQQQTQHQHLTPVFRPPRVPLTRAPPASGNAPGSPAQPAQPPPAVPSGPPTPAAAAAALAAAFGGARPPRQTPWQAAAAAAADAAAEEEAAALSRADDLDRIAEACSVRRLCLGEDRWHRKYWLLGSTLPGGPQHPDGGAARPARRSSTADGGGGGGGSHGLVFVQTVPHHTIVGLAFAGAVPPGVDAAAAEAAALPPPVGPEGRPGEQRRWRLPGGGWGVYATLPELDALLEALDPMGARESPLRAALERVRDLWALSEGPAAASQQQQQQQQQQEEQQPEPDEGPPLAASMDVDGEHAASDKAPAARARAALQSVWSSIPAQCFDEFWGAGPRRASWLAALPAARSPAHFSALLSALEGSMVLPTTPRAAWRLWSQPSMHPAAAEAGGWAAVLYRLAAFEACIKGRKLPSKSQLQRAAEREARALGLGAGGRRAAKLAAMARMQSGGLSAAAVAVAPLHEQQQNGPEAGTAAEGGERRPSRKRPRAEAGRAEEDDDAAAAAAASGSASEDGGEEDGSEEESSMFVSGEEGEGEDSDAGGRKGAAAKDDRDYDPSENGEDDEDIELDPAGGGRKGRRRGGRAGGGARPRGRRERAAPAAGAGGAPRSRGKARRAAPPVAAAAGPWAAAAAVAASAPGPQHEGAQAAPAVHLGNDVLCQHPSQQQQQAASGNGKPQGAPRRRSGASAGAPPVPGTRVQPRRGAAAPATPAAAEPAAPPAAQAVATGKQQQLPQPAPTDGRKAAAGTPKVRVKLPVGSGGKRTRHSAGAAADAGGSAAATSPAAAAATTAAATPAHRPPKRRR